MRNEPDNKGFTFLEVIVTVAIIGILSTVAIVYSTSYLKRARASKAMAQLSSTIPAMYQCWGNGGSVPDRDIGHDSDGKVICQIGGVDAPTYGVWPMISGDLANYSYSNFGTGNGVNKVFWLGLYSAADGKKVCCNSTMKSCVIGEGNFTCSSAVPAY